MGQVGASGENARARANGIEFPIIEIPNGRAGEPGEREGKGGGGGGRRGGVGRADDAAQKDASGK